MSIQPTLPVFVLVLHQPALERILTLEPQKRRQKHHAIIEGDEAAEDPQVAPDVRVRDAEAPAKLVARRVLAELAQSIRRDLHVSAGLLDIGQCVGLAGLPRRRALKKVRRLVWV